MVGSRFTAKGDFMAQPKVTVTETKPQKYTAGDLEFTKPHPERYEKFKDHPKLKTILQVMNGRAAIAIEAEQDMGLLDKDVRAGWPNNVALAKKRELGRRKTQTEEELAIWEAHRNPRTGVPPADVYGSLDGGWILEN